jgi:hypothetical protein
MKNTMKYLVNAKLLVLAILIMLGDLIFAQTTGILVLKPASVAKPFDEVVVSCPIDGSIVVSDGEGKIYFRSTVHQRISFLAGGSAGIHKIKYIDSNNAVIDSASFILETHTTIDDGGKYHELFNMLHDGMFGNGRKGYGAINWQGKNYKFYVPWDLDNNNVLNGMQYFLPYGAEFTDLLRETQRKDGMIWSFVRGGKDGYHYYETAYDWINFFRKDSDAWFVRQPVDNHSDYNYVNQFYKHWKASGDNQWLAKTIASAALALDYCYTDSIRWSKRFQLLKRPYCIDSWDFQVEDEYTPEAPISPAMVVVPGKTKFGVFFGDNTGYFEACNQVAEMYDTLGETEKATIYRERGKAILENLIKVSWNGRFFTHFIDEDSTVKRNLGVDEKSQIAQGNMYSINRGLPHEMNVAIIKTYMQLKENLPVGSPGEWYSIYPPFERGFGDHNEKWQYMNGGIAGHAIGELAKGAYESGYENYASDIMNRFYDLGKKYNNKIYFSYTGSIPLPPPPPVFQPIDISKQANMDLWDKGSNQSLNWMGAEKASGNDMRGLPTGKQTFQGINFNVIDPEVNNRKAVIAVSVNNGLPREVEVPVNKNAGAVYLLHSSSDNVPSNVASAITFIYADGSEASQYLFKQKEVTNWWFPELYSEKAGVAWTGPNLKSTKVGVCWAAINNPHPEKTINKLKFSAPLEGGIYAVIGITLADRAFYIAPKGESYGGPDNWAAANGMSALVEGLAGVKNKGLAFNQTKLSPRWISAGIDSVNVTVQLAASNTYIAYQYKYNKKSGNLSMIISGSGNNIDMHVLLPENTRKISSVQINGKSVPYKISTIESAKYADFDIPLKGIENVEITL